MMTGARALIPRRWRHAASAQLAAIRAARLERDLATLAAGNEVIVAGPWLGEVGFEVLYWVPFLAWFAERFCVDPERLLIVSRGGTASWYRPFARGYRDIFERLTPDQFRHVHDARVAAHGEQKQRRALAIEHELLQKLVPDVAHRCMLHPSTMFHLFNPFWWGHVDERWVFRRARYRRLTSQSDGFQSLPAEPYVAVKFYFNDCFPATPGNRAFVVETIRRLVAAGPVVSLTTGLRLDDHATVDVRDLGAIPLRPLNPVENLAVQTCAVAGASAFFGTYGGFSYLAPFHGVPSTAYYEDAQGFSPRHLRMARAALACIGAVDLLEVQAVPALVASRT